MARRPRDPRQGDLRLEGGSGPARRGKGAAEPPEGAASPPGPERSPQPEGGTPDQAGTGRPASPQGRAPRRSGTEKAAPRRSRTPDGIAPEGAAPPPGQAPDGPGAAGVPLPEGWAHLPFFRARWPEIARALAAEDRAILPAPGVIFRALTLTPPGAVRVVILGQDPYPTPGNADGLAFSVPAGQRLPASLRNIFKEMEDDLGCRPASGDLAGWARQGVLLLNTALTVLAGEAGGHRRLGWGELVAEVLGEVSRRPTAFICWGAPARALVERQVTGAGHLVLASPHPSPLAAHRGFFGSRPFGAVNAWLTARGEPPVDWCGGGAS